MSVSDCRKSANSVVGHVHYASKSTTFNIEWCDVSKQYVLHCENDARRQTAELFIGNHQTVVYMVISDLVKPGHKQVN